MAPSKRRIRGEGSLYQRKGDGRWVGSFYSEEGKRISVYGDTQKEALEKLKAAQREYEQGKLATGPNQTVKHYLEYWLEDVHKSTIRLSSYLRYRQLLDIHILPTLGHIQLKKLTPQHIQALYGRKLKEGLSAGSVRFMHAVLHKALDNALHINLVARNVCDVVSPPRKTKYEIQVLNEEQAHKLLAVAQGHRLEALLVLALTTGLRRGELLALRWHDINFEDRSLQVRRTVNRYTGHGFVETEPKTPKSRRKITIPQFAVEMLRQHRTRQLEARLQVGTAWQEHDLVFCNTSGNFLLSDRLREMLEKLLKEAELPHMRFHDLRHSAATILLSMGIHPKVVQELLGHSTISLTMDTYSHVLPSMHQNAMDRMDNLFGQSGQSYQDTREE